MENFGKQNIEQDSYKTGSTNPPKKRSGLVAGLLIVVILLAGVSSILGVMNIQLFRMLQADREALVSFSGSMPTEATEAMLDDAQKDSTKSIMGLTAEDISQLDRQYYDLPEGVLICAVEKKGCAAKAGLAVGDIILSINGAEVRSVQGLEQALQGCKAGDQVAVAIYRCSTEKRLETTVIYE